MAMVDPGGGWDYGEDTLVPDIMLMDLNLPRRNGIEATREILAAQPRIMAIALPTYQVDETVAAGIQAGVTGYVRKDLRATELLQAKSTDASTVIFQNQ